MTPEDKKLLLKDISARLPYGVKCRQFKLDSQICTLAPVLLDEVENIEPYLRPMSSMTEEERREYDKLIAKCIYDPEAYFFDNYDMLYDWLNAHHFDYRGLIEKGLALEAKEGMYKF